GVTSSRAVIVDDLLWRVRTLRMILSVVTAPPNMHPQVLRCGIYRGQGDAMTARPNHRTGVHCTRQSLAERLRRELQRQAARRTAQPRMVRTRTEAKVLIERWR